MRKTYRLHRLAATYARSDLHPKWPAHHHILVIKIKGREVTADSERCSQQADKRQRKTWGTVRRTALLGIRPHSCVERTMYH